MIIHGTDIVLRDWHSPDLDTLAPWLQPGQAWKELDAPYYPFLEPDEIAGYLERKQRTLAAEPPNPRMNLVIAEAASNHLIGAVNAYWESIETLWLTAGIVIYDPAFWGRGIGYQAFGLWTDYQFRARPEIVRLDLRTWSGNYGMIAVAHKLGFVQEACFRAARIVHGEYYDSLAFGILRHEWDSHYPQGFQHSLK